VSVARRASPDAAGERRVPPHDLDAERAILSCILLDNATLPGVILELRAADFYHDHHKRLYEAMLALHEERQPVDLLTLSDHLTTHKQLEAVGGAASLGTIADFESTAAHVLHYAKIVRDKSVLRRLIGVATELVEMGFSQEDAADRLLDEAESKVLEISQAARRTSFRSLHDEMPETFDYVEEIMNRGGSLTGLPTGFKELDKMTGGLQAGELTVLAARPSMGKTALALNIARNHAVDYNGCVAFFSLEMTKRELVLRLLLGEAQVDNNRFRNGVLSDKDWRKLTQAASVLENARILFDDSMAVTVGDLAAKARRLDREQKLSLLVIDYIQLVQGRGTSERREQQVADISRSLKLLAKDLDIPVIALSQLNRGPESRPDKRPQLGDLRESGAIEQDADIVMFVYRDEVYDPETPDAGKAEVIISKQRNGPTGTVKLYFDKEHGRFRSLSHRSDSPPPEAGFDSSPADGWGPPAGSGDVEPPF
jgi:replicative DNA helicase